MASYNSFLSFLGITLVISLIAISKANVPEVKLVNVVFRHGDRTPDRINNEMYPNDPYLNCTFYPVGYGGLTNQGKRREYVLGKILRERYNKFLGSIYEPEAVQARSSDYDRTKMSLQLVLSSLYPPEKIQLWNTLLHWQPIPTTYRTVKNDVLFFPEYCFEYNAEYERIIKEREVTAKVAEFSNLMNILTEKTGKPMKTILDLFYLYHTFVAESSMNLSLPDWAEKIFPHGELFDAAVLEYEILSYNTMMRRLNGGMLVHEIVQAMVNYRNHTLTHKQKIYLYSGHETNVASVLQTLGVYKPHVPEYSSAAIIELLKLRNKYYVQVLHYLGIPPTIVEVTVPGCDKMCPLDKFLKLIKDVIPSNEEFNCTRIDDGIFTAAEPSVGIINNLIGIIKDKVWI